MEKVYIICVDDQREVLSSVVRDMGVFTEWTVVEECESAEEAYELVDELDGDGKLLALIVCDHIMPGQDGVDFLAELARDKRFPHIKKILLTGQATHADTINAINKAKIDCYFEKPWQPGPLQDACRRLLSEYLFDAGIFTKDFRKYVDPAVLLERMSGQE